MHHPAQRKVGDWAFFAGSGSRLLDALDRIEVVLLPEPLTVSATTNGQIENELVRMRAWRGAARSDVLAQSLPKKRPSGSFSASANW
eukprot:m.40547 g.40547  ORF g.40547 m.40547 type:complete len:87 (+) comp6002_c0_seq2:268-528(+)